MIGAYREPSPGWIDKSALFGASGVSFLMAGSNLLQQRSKRHIKYFLYFCQVFVGVGLGVLHVELFRNHHPLGYVPVDIVNNATIIAAYHSNMRWNNDQTQINIIAVVETRNPVTIGKYSRQ